MEHLWRLMTAVFLIAVSLALFVVGWIFSSGTFDDYVTAVSLYVTLAGIVWGTCRGVSAIVGHQRASKKKEDQE